MSNWTILEWIGVIGVVIAFISMPIWRILFVRRKREIAELIYIEQERDNFRSQNAKQSVRLNAIDPERFIDRINDLRRDGDFAKAEEASLAFSNAQNEAFGLAAEVLTEQRILDSGEQGEWAVKDAQRFAAIGLAANPESTRLKELQKLADTRAEGLERGEPIETLDWDGMSDLELNRLAIALEMDGKYQLAEIAASRSVPLALTRTGKVSENYSDALNTHAICLSKMADYDEAKLLYREVLEIDTKTIGVDHPKYAQHLNNLAELLNTKGDQEAAEPLFRRAIEISTRTNRTDLPDHAAYLNNLAGLLHDKGDYTCAEPLYRQALEIAAKTIGSDHFDYANILNNLALLLQVEGDYYGAEPLYRQALEIDAKTIGTNHPNYATRLFNLSCVLTAKGDHDAAEQLLQQAVSVLESALGTDHPRSINMCAAFESQFCDKP